MLAFIFIKVKHAIFEIKYKMACFVQAPLSPPRRLGAFRALGRREPGRSRWVKGKGGPVGRWAPPASLIIGLEDQWPAQAPARGPELNLAALRAAARALRTNDLKN